MCMLLKWVCYAMECLTDSQGKFEQSHAALAVNFIFLGSK